MMDMVTPVMVKTGIDTRQMRHNGNSDEDGYGDNLEGKIRCVSRNDQSSKIKPFVPIWTGMVGQMKVIISQMNQLSGQIAIWMAMEMHNKVIVVMDVPIWQEIMPRYLLYDPAEDRVKTVRLWLSDSDGDGYADGLKPIGMLTTVRVHCRKCHRVA